MAHNLPPEIVDLILGQLHYFEDRLTLETCGLVCRSWLHPSRTRVFADIYLHQDNIASFCDVAQDSAVFPIAACIRRLTLEYIEDTPSGALHGVRSLFPDAARSELDDDLERLGPFIGVQTLRLEMSSDVLDRHAVFLGTICPNISTLDIEAANTGALGAVLRAVAAFPSTHTLKIRDLDHCPASTHPLSPAYRFPAGLRAVDLAAHDVDNFFRGVLALEPVPVFSSVSTWNAWPDAHSQLGAYLRRVGPHVRHLCLDSYVYDLEAGCPYGESPPLPTPR